MCEKTTTKYTCGHIPKVVKPCKPDLSTKPETCPSYKELNWNMTRKCSDCAGKIPMETEGENNHRAGGSAVGQGWALMK
jgi:hypothetical protein